MKNDQKNKLFKALGIVACLLCFAVVTLIYFSPILDGKRLKQHDIEMYKGMSKEITDYRAATGEQSLWTNSMFGGMPAWNISVKNNSNLMTRVNKLLNCGFPSPIGSVFISMLGFFILLLVLDCNVWISFIGGIAYGLTSYLLIVIGAGHNTKAMAMAYMAPVIAGMLLTYKGKYLLGSVLTAIALALEVRANHLQITYYLLLIVIILFIAQLISDICNKQLIRFLKATGCLILAAILGILTNTTTLYANYKYSKDTTRGKPVLVQDAGNQTKGLDRDYITQWSYGKGETWSLLIPNAKGGATAQIGMKHSALKAADSQFREAVAQQNAYWGDQPFTSGPVYVGAIVVFLLVLSIVLLISEWEPVLKKIRYKIAIPVLIMLFGVIYFILYRFLLQDVSVWMRLKISLFLTTLFLITYVSFKAKPIWTGLFLATILSILLSWGKNLQWFSDFFIDYVPGYNKFRAVSMTLVIAEVCMPLLGFLGLAEIVNHPENRKKNITKALVALGLTAGCCLLFYFAPRSFFNFLSQSEAQQFAQLKAGKDGTMYAAFAKQLENVRVAIFCKDTLRSLLLIVLSAIPVLLLTLFPTKKGVIIPSFAILGILVLVDLIPIDQRYLNKDNFISKKLADKPFTPSTADQMILNDKTLDYRVLNLTKDVFNDASTSYFHKSIGGYHGAKLRRYQDLINGYLSPELRQLGKVPFDELRTLNMLNTRYIIYDPNAEPILNPYAFGNAWIVNNVQWVDTPNEEFDALGTTDLRHTAILHKAFQQQVGAYSFTDSIPGQITLTEYKPNRLTYNFKAEKDQLVVFSEIWSDTGWKLYVDGKEHPLLRANYLLRSSLLPSGEHQIVMEYAPSIWKTGNTIQFISSLIILLCAVVAIILQFRKTSAQPA